MRLWRNRDFKAVLLGQGISNLGDAVSVTALPLLVLSLTGSGVQMGLVGTLERLPPLVFGLPAGALADRWNRRRTMLACDLGRALLTALIPLSMTLGIRTMLVIYFVAAPISVLGVLFRASYTACLPRLVEREQIGPANSYFEALESFCWIIGPGVAGLLSGWIGPGPTIIVDAVSFLISAIAIGFVTRPLQGDERHAKQNIFREMGEGIAFVSRHALLRAVIAFWSLGRIIFALLVPAITFYVTVDRKMSAYTVGFVLSAYAFGSLLGTLLAARVASGGIGGLMLAGYVLMGASIIMLAFLSNVPLMLMAAFAFGLAEGLVLVLYLTLRAVATPDEILGRVGSTSDTVNLGLGSLGMLGGGFLLDFAGGSRTLVLMGLLAITTSLLFAFSPSLRRAHTS